LQPDAYRGRLPEASSRPKTGRCVRASRGSLLAVPALGALVIGTAAEALGLPAPVAVGALLGLLAALWLWRRREAIGRSLAPPIPASAD